MHARRSIPFLVLPLLVGVLLVTSRFSAQEGVNSPEKLVELMEQRRDVLQEYVLLIESRHQTGSVQIDRVFDARDKLFSAELELASDREKRLELMTARVANLKAAEDRIHELQKVGVRGGTQEEALLATSHRLLAEIELQRALTSDQPMLRP